jgi:hypothetical protein
MKKRCKVNREDIVAIKGANEWFITDSIAKANSLNIYYSPVFSCERSFSQIQCAKLYEPFAINTTIITRRLAAIDKNKSVGTDRISDQILKLDGESRIP